MANIIKGEDEIREKISIRLPSYLLKKVKNQGNASRFIEKAVLHYFDHLEEKTKKCK